MKHLAAIYKALEKWTYPLPGFFHTNPRWTINT